VEKKRRLTAPPGTGDEEPSEPPLFWGQTSSSLLRASVAGGAIHLQPHLSANTTNSFARWGCRYGYHQDGPCIYHQHQQLCLSGIYRAVGAPALLWGQTSSSLLRASVAGGAVHLQPHMSNTNTNSFARWGCRYGFHQHGAYTYHQ
jgi:hypothetical protein